MQTLNQHTGHILVSSSLLANERQTETETAREPPAFAEDAAAISSPPLPSHLPAHVYLSVTPAPRGHFCLPPPFKTFHPVRFHSTTFTGVLSPFPPCSHPQCLIPHALPPSILASHSPFCVYSRGVSYVTRDDSAAAPYNCCSSDLFCSRAKNCLPALGS